MLNKYHLKPTPMRHHELLDQRHMPLKQQQQQQQQEQETKGSRTVHMYDIEIIRQNKCTPIISGGVVMPANRLALVDHNNSNITMIELADSTVQTQLSLKWPPQDITLFNSTKVAVTCPGAQTIIFVNVKDRLQLEHEVKVKGQCMGIACTNDRLVVSYCDPVKVEILSMSGKVLQTVVTEDQGKRLFSSPWYVEVSRDHGTIYISDCHWQKHTVTSLSLAGQVLATYHDTKLVREPRGLAVDTAGSVYVCGYFTNNFVQLAADLTQPRQLLQESDGVKDPLSVCYCQATDRLYIAMYEPDVIKVI